MAAHKRVAARRRKQEQRPLRALKARARRILGALDKAHPDARIYLDFQTPLQLLVATVLAAQCTDEKVNQITPVLFERYPSAEALARADQSQLEQMVRPTGFFRQKARSVRECCRAIVEEHGGKVPADLDALTRVRGVGRKTANVVLANAFGIAALPVDTHVLRVGTRLGLAEGTDADKVEQQLCEVIPEERWIRAGHLLGTHGRRICTAKKPDHENCPVKGLCDFYRALEAATG
jgi:endonuclease-3